jgi:dihydroorotase
MEALKNKSSWVSVETLPQFLLFSSPSVYEKLGTRGQMNPPIRFEEDRLAVWKAVQDRIVDVLGTDHAPHTIEEKNKPYPESPSGMPGVQTLVPVMLTLVNEGKLSLEDFVRLTSKRVAEIFALKNKGVIKVGNDADFTIVDLKKTHTIRDAEMATKSGWTPYDGFKATGMPSFTVLQGQIAMRDGVVVGPPKGQPLEFLDV